MTLVAFVAHQLKHHNVTLSQLIAAVAAMGGCVLLGSAEAVRRRHGAAPAALLLSGAAAGVWLTLYREPRMPNLKAAAGTPRSHVLRFVAVSDTHNQHEKIRVPFGDVFVHTGDFTNKGTLAEMSAFNEWLGELPHRHKIVVLGNHELAADRPWYAENWQEWHPQPEVDPVDGELGIDARRVLSNATVLMHESFEVAGVRIFGSSIMPEIEGHVMAFAGSDETRRAAWTVAGGAPAEPVDVLLTHSPPRGIRDRIFVGKNVGCTAILEAAARLSPRVHIFGHVHEQYGAERVDGTWHVNAASVAVVGHRAVPGRAVVFDVPRQP